MGFFFSQENFYLLSFVLLMGATEKNLAPCSWFPCIKVFIYLSLLFSRLNIHSSLSLSSYEWWFSPLIIFKSRTHDKYSVVDGEPNVKFLTNVTPGGSSYDTGCMMDKHRWTREQWNNLDVVWLTSGSRKSNNCATSSWKTEVQLSCFQE